MSTVFQKGGCPGRMKRVRWNAGHFRGTGKRDFSSFCLNCPARFSLFVNIEASIPSRHCCTRRRDLQKVPPAMEGMMESVSFEEMAVASFAGR